MLPTRAQPSKLLGKGEHPIARRTHVLEVAASALSTEVQAVAASRWRREMSAQAAQVSSGTRPTFISWAKTKQPAQKPNTDSRIAKTSSTASRPTVTTG